MLVFKHLCDRSTTRWNGKGFDVAITAVAGIGQSHSI